MISKGRGCFRIRLIGASASELEKIVMMLKYPNF